MSEFIEALAELEHEQWMSWANSLLTREPINTLLLFRWCKYMVPYSELSEEVKEHDREWARKAMAIVEERLMKLEEENRKLQTVAEAARKLNTPCDKEEIEKEAKQGE